MIHLKNSKEQQIMAEGGKILAEVLFKVLDQAKVGVSELELDALAEKLILSHPGAEPGFKKVPGYKHTICVSVNEVVVHGIPTAYKLQPGDVLGIDCGVFYAGFHTDMSESIRIIDGKLPDDQVSLFLQIGKQALNEAIKVVKPGNRIGHISQTIQRIVETGGYSVVRSLIGHGVGKKLHEDPEIPGYLMLPLEKTPLLKAGMTLAIEVIYNQGKPEVVYKKGDNWTIKSKDNSLSGLFERTVLVTNQGSKMLTE